MLFASTANDTLWFKFRLFSIASFDEVAIATNAAWTTPYEIEIATKQTKIIFLTSGFVGLKAW